MSNRKFPDNAFLTELSSRSLGTKNGTTDELSDKIAEAIPRDTIVEIVAAPRDFVTKNRESSLKELERRGFDSDPRILLAASLKSCVNNAHAYSVAIQFAMVDVLASVMASMISQTNYQQNKHHVISTLREELEHITSNETLLSDKHLDELISNALARGI